MRNRSWILTLLLPLLLWGCESDSDNGGGGSVGNFAGTWTITTTVVAKAVCDDSQVGDTETEEIDIVQVGSQITIVTPGDDIILTAEGSTATGTNVDGDRTEEIEITVSGNSLSGEVNVTGSDCTEVVSITGTRTSSPPDPAFAGYWDVTVNVETSTCPDETPGDTFTQCMSIMLDGNTVILDDDSGDGPIVGTANGNSATLTRSDKDGTLSVEITLTPGGFGFTGTATSEDFFDECTATYTITGAKRSSDCGGGGTGGDWAGYWDSTPSNVQDGCGEGVVGGCVEFIQDGDEFYPADNPSEVYQIDGNTASYFFSETFEGSTFIVDIDLTLNGDTITGTGLISISGEFVNCTTTFDITATRRSSPCPDEAAIPGFAPSRR